MKDIQRLLGVYPPVNSDDPEQVVRDYLFAVDDHTAQDVTAAVNAFLKGSVPGTNAAFVPSAPVLAAEVRRQMNLRLDHEYRVRLSQPKLPAPDIERTPEARARMQAKVDAFLADVAVKTEDPEAIKRRSAQWAKTNARFMPDMNDEALAARLAGKRGFDIGYSEDDAA